MQEIVDEINVIRKERDEKRGNRQFCLNIDIRKS